MQSRDIQANETGINQAQREKILTSLNLILSLPGDPTYYYDSINSLLSEMNVSIETFFKMCMGFLSRHSKDKNDLKLISAYLFLMKNFTKIFAEIEDSQLTNQVLTISKHLGYERMDKNKVLMRFGEKGIKAYIMLSGNIDILIKTTKKMKVSEKNYILYIGTLVRYKEYGLLNLVINENYQKYPLEIDDDINDEPNVLYQLNQKNTSFRHKDKAKIIKASQLLNMFNDEVGAINSTNKKKEKDLLNNVTTTDYINRLNVCQDVSKSTNKYGSFSPDEIDAIDVVIFSYMKVASLTTGALFGEIALSDPAALRTATIITTSDCFFGTLNKTTYNQSLKICKEKIFQATLGFIVSIKLFKLIKHSTLGKKYFNNFSAKKVYKGENLIVEGEKISSLYLLREGEYEMTIKASLKELTTVITKIYSKLPKTANKIMKITQSDRAIEAEVKENPNLGKIYYAKQIFRLTSLNAPDVVGLSDWINEEKGVSFFTLECKTAKGEVLELSNIFYNEMKNKEDSIESQEKSLTEKKNKILVDRLNSIRSSKLKIYSDFMKYKFDIESEIESDIQRNNAMKRQKDTKKTVINAKDVKLVTTTQPLICTERKNISEYNKNNNPIFFHRNEKKRMTIDVPKLKLRTPFPSSRKESKKETAFSSFQTDLRSEERRVSVNPYAFSEEMIKFLNEKKEQPNLINSFNKTQKQFRTQQQFPLSQRVKRKKKIFINDLALETLEPNKRIFLLEQLSQPYNSRNNGDGILSSRPSYIANSVMPFNKISEDVLRTEKRTKTVTDKNIITNNERGKYLQYSINKIKATMIAPKLIDN